MAITNNLINIGHVVNDGLGDDLRTAFRKVNENFLELNTLGTLVAENLTTAGYKVFNRVYKNDSGANVLEFKTIQAGENITISESPTMVTIAGYSPKAFNQIQTDTNTVTANFSTGISIKGGIAPGGKTPDIEVSGSGSAITVRNVFPVTDVLTGFDLGILSGPRNVVDILVSAANIDFGTITSPGALDIDFGTLGS